MDPLSKWLVELYGVPGVVGMVSLWDEGARRSLCHCVPVSLHWMAENLRSNPLLRPNMGILGGQVPKRRRGRDDEVTPLHRCIAEDPRGRPVRAPRCRSTSAELCCPHRCRCPPVLVADALPLARTRQEVDRWSSQVRRESLVRPGLDHERELVAEPDAPCAGQPVE